MRAMKDSGVEWIGEIPEAWEVRRLKYCASMYTGNSIKDEEKNLYEDPEDAYPYISSKDIDLETNSADYANGMYVKHTDKRFKIAPNGSTLMCIEGGSAGRKKVLLNEDVAFVNKLCCFVPISIFGKFLYYYLNSPDFEDVFRQHISGMIGGVSVSNLERFPVPIPTAAEQQRIAAYLDEQCGEIDKVLAKTRESIEEYKKLKQSVITEAVTKGIRPDRPMKPSGIEWIGDIPEEWGIRRLRHLGCCQNGISKGAEFFGSGYPFVSYSDVYKNMELPRWVNGLVESTDEERERYSVLHGDIFFTRTSETIEEIGFTAVCLNTIPNATFAGFLIRVRPTTSLITSEFSKYYFRSDSHRCFFVKEMNLVTRASLGQELLKKLPVLLPPLDEQQEIVAYLDQQCAEIDRLIAKKEQIITELESYKKSLIYECVTGKREVV